MLPVRVIPLTQGQFAIVDPEDYAAVSAYKWYANKNRYTFYAHSFDQHFVSMHTLITGFARTDHANRSGTDNRRSNLRFASCSQNTANSRLRRDNQAGYKGVFPHGNAWQVQVSIVGKQQFAGTYDSTEDAARAYDHAATQYYGDFALTNASLGLVSHDICKRRCDYSGPPLRIRGASKFTGVYWHNQSKTWRARISVNGKRIGLGNFRSEIDAARAYDQAAIEYHSNPVTNQSLGLIMP